MPPNWIVKIEVEWPGLDREHPETAFDQLRPALQGFLSTLKVLYGWDAHWHRISVPRREGEAANG